MNITMTIAGVIALLAASFAASVFGAADGRDRTALQVWGLAWLTMFGLGIVLLVAA